MTFNAARASLAASAAFAIIIGMAVAPASAQTKTWPAGTDCTKLVGNDKTECANQAKNSASPDNSNNPSTGTDATTSGTSNGTAASGSTNGTGTNMPASTETKDYKGKDCTSLVGTDNDECAAQNKQDGEPDNSNNPAKSEPAQSN